MKRGFALILFSIAVILLVNGLPISALAQSNLNLSQTETTTPPIAKTALVVTPVFNQLAVKQGEASFSDTTVTNLSPVPLPIKAYTRAFVASDETGGSDYPDETNPRAVQHWFLIDTPDFILQPGSSKSIHVTINVPKDAEPGGHYATLFFESLIPREALSDTSLYLASRIGVPFFMVASGDIAQSGFIFAHMQAINFSLPVNFSLSFNNTGNVHISPKSTITILNWRGKTIETMQDTGQVALPGNTRVWNLVWAPHFAFGRYTVHIESTIEDNGAMQKNDLTFWVVPLVPVLCGFGILVLMLFIITRGRKRMVKALRVLRGRE